MNCGLFQEAMGKLDDRYLGEALDYRAKSHRLSFRRGLLAACLSLAAVSLLAMPGILRRGEEAPPSPNVTTLPKQPIVREDPPEAFPPTVIVPEDVLASGQRPIDTTAPVSTQNPAGLAISIDDIVFNSLSASAAAAPRWYDPALYDQVVWNAEEIAAYYGKSLTPPYLPEGMTERIGCRVVLDKDGTVVVDTVNLSYRYAGELDGASLSITVSRLGFLQDCVYLLPENEVKSARIADTEVIFGYRSMPYGPYDPATKAPAGFYDLYTSEFTMDGIGYQIVAERMAAEELVYVVASILSDHANLWAE